eukprot:566188-Pelagomonas_calceolata.AAC.5
MICIKREELTGFAQTNPLLKILDDDHLIAHMLYEREGRLDISSHIVSAPFVRFSKLWKKDTFLRSPFNALENAYTESNVCKQLRNGRQACNRTSDIGPQIKVKSRRVDIGKNSEKG